MNATEKLFPIVARLVEQPTWGGTYIAHFKNLPSIETKIGQSYELYGGSFLQDPETKKTFILSEIVKSNPEKILGPDIYQLYAKMPLLIKFTQAMGNSFQLHRKPNHEDQYWQPKAESWYYLEDGILTYGIKKGADIEKYKTACVEIQTYMSNLSADISGKKITQEEAREKAENYIKKINPWQFVNQHTVRKNTLIDLSPGGIHHSWEEDPVHFPHGNIVYEVQQDVADEFCTLRSFDKGKFDHKGKIRTVHIEDYFRHIDTSEKFNNIAFALKKPSKGNLLKTKYYSLDLLTIKGVFNDIVKNSFIHLFVQEGEVTISSQKSTIPLSKGYSCFIPYSIQQYEIKSKKTAKILKTYIEV